MKAEIQTRTNTPQHMPEARFRNYWRILYSHKWVVILGFLCVMMATILYLATKKPVYRSSTTLMSEQNIGTSYFLSGGSGLPFIMRQTIQKQQILLQSNLVVDEISRLMAEAGIAVTAGEIRGFISLSQVTNEGDVLRISATSDDPRKAMLLANTAADVYAAKSSDLASVDLEQAQGFLSEQMEIVDASLKQAEEALEAYREQTGIVGGYSKQETASGLLKQLGDLYAELSQTQNDQDYARARLNATRQILDKKRKEVASLGNNNLVSQIESLRALISKWQADLVILQQTLTEKSREVIDMKEKIATAQSQLDSYFQELKRHEASIDPLSEWQSLSQEYTQLDMQLKELQQKEIILKQRIEKFKTEHPQLISKEVELTRLERTARMHEQTYMLLTDKYEQMRLLKQIRNAGVSVVDRAQLPGSPVSPNRRQVITFGMLIGILMGVGAAFFLEYIDNSLRVEKDIERYLALPIVGVIPLINIDRKALKALEQTAKPDDQNTSEDNDSQSPIRMRKRNENYHKILSNLKARKITTMDPKSPITESYRTLWANIQFSKVDEKIGTILVSSSGPREGKTITVANLAITMAHMGVKTLLIDTDLRRPKLHYLFEQQREPGLSDFLVSESNADGHRNPGNPESQVPNGIDEIKIIRSTEIENLYLISSGKRPPNPVELLSSNRMLRLVEKLREEFDMILFDSPPVVPVTDAAMLASGMADIVLLVVRSGVTKREMAQKALELLEKVDAKIFGAVLNTIDYTKQYGSYYYYYYYHYYYSHDDREV